MAITALDLSSEPWMVCDPEDDAELDRFIGNSGIDETTVTKRAPTPREVAKITAERLLRSKRGEDPDKLFGIAL